jgi:tRNA threonylcarbamoyl adenosine modification protein (Sua5/YciO/YrdC/YwlC family)
MSAADDPLAAAVAALRAGAVVAVPTDTVYGLVVAADRPAAAAALAEAKGRSSEVPVQVLVADAAQAAALTGPGGLGVAGERLARRYWSGGLTLVVRRRPGLAWDLGGDGTTIGLRAPDHPVPAALCRAVGPLAATSANHHGAPPLTTAAEVRDELGDAVAVIVDGGPGGQTASTVVDVTGTRPVLLREGAIAWADVQAVADGDDPAR